LRSRPAGGGARGRLRSLALPHRGRAQGAGRRGHPGHPHREAAAMSAPVRWTGRLSALGPADIRSLLSRARGDAEERDLPAEVARMIADVRARGDAALRDLARRFDRVSLESLEVPRAAILAALDRQPLALRRAMERSARNVTRVHAAFRPQATRLEVEPG